jgi:hypothetical protein
MKPNNNPIKFKTKIKQNQKSNKINQKQKNKTNEQLKKKQTIIIQNSNIKYYNTIKTS